jgi:tripartite-type tricarboxylate transporter receptor subunit TctC
VPFSASSTIDIIGRIVLDPPSRQLGQNIVAENRGGAGGSLGSAAVAKADPDGYTLLINAPAHSGAPAAYPNLPYDAAADFAGVAIFGSVPNVLLIASSKNIKTLQELVAKAKDGSMSFASAGVGSAHPLGSRALHCQRRPESDTCSFPWRPGGADRGHDRPR